MGKGSVKVSHCLNTRHNHFAVMKDGNMRRVPFSNKGSREEFQLHKDMGVTHCREWEGVLQLNTRYNIPRL